MTPHALVLGLIVGAVAVVFGLVPGLFGALMEGVQSFRDALLFGVPAVPRRPVAVHAPHWLAVAGAVFMAFTAVVYLLG